MVNIPQVADDPQETPLLAVRDLARDFDASGPTLRQLLKGGRRVRVKAVDGVDFEVARGKTFSLVGESGCGKSTVARMIVGLYEPTRGDITFDGVSLGNVGSDRRPASLRRRMQMIFQDPYASLNPRWRVSRIIAEPVRTHGLVRQKGELNQKVDELLGLVGLSSGDSKKYPHEFSGGQRQRISIARALSSDPEFLVCDEPTSALDVSVQAQILNLMKRLQRTMQLTYLFISHNLAVVKHMSDHVGVMYLGRLVEFAPTDVLFSQPQHPYTRMLIDAVPDLNTVGQARTPVSGEVPNPINPPSGCTFHPRCPLANTRCMAERPRHMVAANGAVVACHAVEEGRVR